MSPDAGGMHRAHDFHKSFEYHGFGEDQVGLAMIHKERKAANVIGSMQLIGDVKGKTCIIVDDMIDTAGTLSRLLRCLKLMGLPKSMRSLRMGFSVAPQGKESLKRLNWRKLSPLIP